MIIVKIRKDCLKRATLNGIDPWYIDYFARLSMDHFCDLKYIVSDFNENKFALEGIVGNSDVKFKGSLHFSKKDCIIIEERYRSFQD